MAQRLRILMCSSYFPPEYSGAALQAIALAKELRRLGHYIEFVTQRWPGLATRDEVEGFRVTRLEAGRGRKHRELRWWWNLYRFVQRRRDDFDFLHSHGSYYKDAIVGPLARGFGMRSLVKASLSNNDLHDLGDSLTGRIHLAMLRRVDACIAVSRDLEREFIAGGVPAALVHYLPNCVDVERFQPPTPEEKQALRRKHGLNGADRVVLYVGVFDQRKNIAWLIREWLRAEGYGLRALLLAVGPQSREDPTGDFKRGLIELAQHAPKLLQIGSETENVAELYRAADVLVMPSEKEGLPNAVLEAMACGLPCVAADVPGTRELVEDGRTGYLFRLDDAEGLRAAMMRALGTTGTAFGASARARVLREFSIKELARRYHSLYENLSRPRA